MKRLGFVVANDQDEYLVNSLTTPGVRSLSWSKHPAMAKYYPVRRMAKQVIRDIQYERPLVIGELFESDTQYLVTLDNAVMS